MELLHDKERLQDLEYFLQLSFFTADLHITRAWTLSNPQESPPFQKKILNLFSAIELCRLEGSKSIDDITRNKEFEFTDKQFVDLVFPLGLLDAPQTFNTDIAGTFSFVIIELWLGRSYFAKKNISEPIPFGYDSLVFTKEQNSGFGLKHLVRIKENVQAFFSALVEIEFKPLRIDVSPPICDHCEACDATVFCIAEESVVSQPVKHHFHDTSIFHLCDTCNYNQHSGNKFFRRHHRVPVSESPHLFGTCEEHPTECVSLCCLTCHRPLCSQCLIFGGHSEVHLKNHRIVKTTEAYSVATESLQEDKLYPQEIELKTHLNAITKQLEYIFSHVDRLTGNINRVAQAAEREIEEISTRKLQACTAAEHQWTSIVQMVEWIQDFTDHLYSALPLGQALNACKRHKILVDFLFKNTIDIYNTLSTFEDSKESQGICSTSSVEIDLPEWILQVVFLVGNLVITQKNHGKTYSWFKKRESYFCSVPQASGVPKHHGVYCIALERFDDTCCCVAPSDKDSFTSIPQPQWIPYTVYTSANRRDDHSFYEIPAADGTRRFSSFEDPLVLPEEYKGPLLFSTKKKSPLNSFGKEKKNTEMSVVFSDTLFKQHDVFTILETMKPSERISEILEEAPFVPGAVNAKEPTIYGADTQPIIPYNSKVSESSTSQEIPQTTEDNLTILWNPSIVPRDEMHLELWSLLKEYRFEALIMILKACPEPRRLHLLRHFSNAANYMGDFENLVYVLFEVERYWVSRLPITMLMNYPSLINPFLQHIFQSCDILIPGDQKFVQSLSIIPFQRIEAYVEGCFDDNPMNGDSISGNTAMYNNSSFNFYDEKTRNLVQKLLKKGCSDQELSILIFQNLRRFLWKTVHESFLKQVLVLTGKDLPCTLRSLLYQLGEYGSYLQTMNYPKDFVKDNSLLFHCERTNMRQQPTKNNIPNPHWHAEDILLRPTRRGLKEFTDPPKKTHIKPSVAFCVEVLMTYIFPPFDKSYQKKSMSSSQVLASWLLSLTYHQIGKAVWRIPLHALSVNRFDLHILSDDDEMMYLNSALILYRWMDKILAGPLYKIQYKTNWSQMPRKGYEAFDYITQELIQMDGDLRQNPSMLEKSWEVCTVDDLLLRTRNFERLILASMTYQQRHTPLKLLDLKVK